MKIRLTLENGKIFEIDAAKVAHDRADFYAKKDDTSIYKEEYNYTISDDGELIDWLQNNMNWWELEPVEIATEERQLSSYEVVEIQVHL